MSLVTSKKLVRDLFQGKELIRPPFIPIITSFAAKLAQMSVQDFLSNPTKLANTLQATYRLLGYDAIVAVYDSAVEAEACGCTIEWPADDSLPSVVGHPLAEGKSVDKLDLAHFSKRGRIPIALEAFQRIGGVAGREVGMIGVVTGPVTLAGHLRGPDFFRELTQEPKAAAEVLEAAGKIMTTMARLYCDLKADGIMVADPFIAQLDPSGIPAVAPFYQSVANIVRYYDASLLLLPGSVANTSHDLLCQLEADAVMLDNHELETRARFAAEGRGFGALISPTVLTSTREESKLAVSACLQQGSKRRFFVSTAGEVPYATSVENLKEITRIIKGAVA